MACFGFASPSRAYIFITLVLWVILSEEDVDGKGVDIMSHKIWAKIIKNCEWHSYQVYIKNCNYNLIFSASKIFHTQGKVQMFLG